MSELAKFDSFDAEVIVIGAGPVGVTASCALHSPARSPGMQATQDGFPDLRSSHCT